MGRLLKAPLPDLKEIAEILADTRGDDKRASEMIRHVRGLLKKSEINVLLVDLNATLRHRSPSVRALILNVKA